MYSISFVRFLSIFSSIENKSCSVFDLLKKEDLKKDLFVCGRLDKDTTGFVLLTNNGPLAHRLLAPKKGVFKEYSVLSARPVTEQNIRQFENGIQFKDGTKCKTAYYIPKDDCYGLIRISEGKFHQIKKIWKAKLLWTPLLNMLAPSWK